jgi:hypothetical protein
MSNDVVKAMAIARDVLEQLEIEDGYVAKHMTYISSRNLLDLSDKSQELQDLLPELQKGGCQVCAVGAFLLSQTRLYDELKASKILRNMGSYGTSVKFAPHEFLLRSFSADQLRLIEGDFECGDDEMSAKDRLKSICENILLHEGHFVPEN